MTTTNNSKKKTTILKPIGIAVIAASLLSMGMISSTQSAFALDVDSDGVEDEGCTVIFWRNHIELWPEPITPTTQFDEVFGFEIPGKPELTMMGALKLKGFGELNRMVKQGTAAYLNAAFLDDDLAFPHSKSTVIRNVEDGLDPKYIQSATYGDDNDLKERFKSLLEANNQICPFIEESDKEDFKEKLREWLKEHNSFWYFFQKWHNKWLRR
jgi:hypothetical protein